MLLFCACVCLLSPRSPSPPVPSPGFALAPPPVGKLFPLCVVGRVLGGVSGVFCWRLGRCCRRPLSRCAWSKKRPAASSSSAVLVWLIVAHDFCVSAVDSLGRCCRRPLSRCAWSKKRPAASSSSAVLIWLIVSRNFGASFAAGRAGIFGRRRARKMPVKAVFCRFGCFYGYGLCIFRV